MDFSLGYYFCISYQPLDNCRYMYYRHSVFKNKNFIDNCIRIGFSFLLLWVVLGVLVYRINNHLLFKKDKYRKYFKQFDKERKYVQYYGIYVISIIIQFATFYILLKSL